MSDPRDTHAPPTSGVAPYLSVRDGAAAIDFYVRAFGAELLERYDFEGKLGHATLRINEGIVMLADEFPRHEAMIGNVAPPTLGNRTTFTLNLYVTDADAWFDRAVAAGATVVRPCQDEFFGRHGKARDPFGHVWSFVALKPHETAPG
ncbi:VOC family protein [Maricaulis sp.]|uniref:VOC family protein n=1 Tax=Maricaulis sp. TaxID=1486257 RepID=UPI0025BB8F87|nr:VOC family protein [Maricaulis sp.]